MNVTFATLPQLRALVLDARHRIAVPRAHARLRHAPAPDRASVGAWRSARTLAAHWQIDPETGHLACRWVSDDGEAVEPMIGSAAPASPLSWAAAWGRS